MDWHPLAPRARLLFYLQAFARLGLFWVPTTVVAAALATFVVPAVWAGSGAVAWLFLQFLAALWLPSLSFDRWAYAVREDDLLIARGVLVRAITAIPVGRIQHVDTQQGPFEQWLGLARLHIHTASGLGADGVIPGLTLERAESLRDQLVRIRGDGGV